MTRFLGLIGGGFHFWLQKVTFKVPLVGLHNFF